VSRPRRRQSPNTEILNNYVSAYFQKTLAGTQARLTFKYKHRKLTKEQLLLLRCLKSRSFIP